MSLASPVKKINNIFFKTLTSGQVYRAEKVVRRGQVTVIKLKDGGLWCSHVDGKYYYPLGRNPQCEDTLRALVDIKAVTEKEYARHMEAYHKAEAKRSLSRDAETLARLLEKYGSIEELRRRIDGHAGISKEGQQMEVLGPDEEEGA